jgi:tRNA pseudouridine38-40 synthase
VTRFRLSLEYDGTPFVGWQRQDNGPSIQAALEDAVFAFSRERITVHGAGRTDAGVHALGQVAHFDIIRETPADTVRDALNFYLRPHPVTVLAVDVAVGDFHARFSAIGREYLYRIINRRAPLAVERCRAWQVIPPLDAEAMHAAAQVLVGKHDFSSFRAAACQAASPVKTLDAISVTRDGDELRVSLKARSFLHSQVRIITGTLRTVGEGKWGAAELTAALEAKDRTAAGPTAPPDGLYLVRVNY